MPWYNDLIPAVSSIRPDRVRKIDGLTITGDLSDDLLAEYGWYYRDWEPQEYTNTSTSITENIES